MTPRRWRPAYIALGSNLDSPAEHLSQAVLDLHAAPGVRVYRVSSVVRSAPLDGSDQPDYLNAVTGVLTDLAALELLRICQSIERDHGRSHDRPAWSARPLDLDLIAVGGERRDAAPLQLPHPGAASRAFVLLPLAEVAPHAHLPGLGRAADLVTAPMRADLAVVGSLDVPPAAAI
ncbi:MAG: 2-amino-4-hydroxy-6-hydroxymethyldihydropteridine diphosphokinase [Gammaproteobacteria bacterium]